jgi:hypothetical protein
MNIVYGSRFGGFPRFAGWSLFSYAPLIRVGKAYRLAGKAAAFFQSGEVC